MEFHGNISTWNFERRAIIVAFLRYLPYLINTESLENMFMPYANNKGKDHPAHLRSLISAFVVHCLDMIIPLVSISVISIL